MFTFSEKTIVVGDWHQNLRWIEHFMEKTKNLDYDTIIHVGDVGFIGSIYSYVKFLEKLMELYDKKFYFIEGNHEDYFWLNKLERDENEMGIVSERIRHLPRGYRAKYKDQTLLFVGGGVSVDKHLRVPGINWWREEEMTLKEIKQIVKEGSADILVSHDCPLRFELNLPSTAMFPEVNIQDSDKNRERLDVLYEEIGAKKVICGHYHMYKKTDELIVLNRDKRVVKKSKRDIQIKEDSYLENFMMLKDWV